MVRNWPVFHSGQIIDIVEIGSFVGRTALAMASPGNSLVHCVDTWAGNPSDPVGSVVKSKNPDVLCFDERLFKTFCKNVGPKLYKTILPCVGLSSTYASVWPLKADIIFIDADHSYESVKEDILAWKRHVRDGGILCGHDFGIFPGVDKAVTELLPGFQRGGRTIWWIKL
jgi:hypothetical protein